MKIISVDEQEWTREPDTPAMEKAGELDYPDAVKEYERLIEEGSIFSMINLAALFETRKDQDGGPDLAKAQFWYARAVEAGSASATYYLGCFYWRQKDYTSAYSAFRTGLDRAYAPSIVRLAHAHIYGRGVGRDLTQARSLLERARALGNLWAMRGLGKWDINVGKNPYVLARGMIRYLLATCQFHIQKKRNPRSERLRK